MGNSRHLTHLSMGIKFKSQDVKVKKNYAKTLITEEFYLVFLGFLLGFFVCLFRPTPVAYVSSQARGGIRAAAATTMQDPSCICSSQLCQILSPLSKTRDGTHVLIYTSCVRYH